MSGLMLQFFSENESFPIKTRKIAIAHISISCFSLLGTNKLSSQVGRNFNYNEGLTKLQINIAKLIATRLLICYNIVVITKLLL